MKLHDRPGSRPLGWAMILLSLLFFLIGGLFVLAPEAGSQFYGLGPTSGSGSFYVRAVGLRDLALATYLLGLTLAGQLRALAILLAGTLIIPAGDILLLAAARSGTPFHFALHGASLLCFAALALWTRQVRKRSATPGRG